MHFQSYQCSKKHGDEKYKGFPMKLNKSYIMSRNSFLYKAMNNIFPNIELDILQVALSRELSFQICILVDAYSQ